MKSLLILLLFIGGININYVFSQKAKPNFNKESTEPGKIYLTPGQSIVDGYFKYIDVKKFSSDVAILANKTILRADSIHYTLQKADSIKNLNIQLLKIAGCKFLNTPLKFDNADYKNIFSNKFQINLSSDTLTSCDLRNINGYLNVESLILNKAHLSISSLKGDLRLTRLEDHIYDNEIQVFNSNLNVDFSYSFIKKIDLSFYNDTIGSYFIYPGYGRLRLEFVNTTLNGLKDNYLGIEGANYLLFDNCIFNMPSVNLQNIDTLAFYNCNNLKTRVSLDLINTKLKYTYLKIRNSDLTNIDFNFSENFRLIFSKDADEDAKEQIYNNLRDKFKREGKSESYQNVDIQYQQYTFSTFGILGNFWNLVDKYWWNYSYSRIRIIFWTIGFIILFFIINLIIAKDLMTFYPIYKLNKDTPFSEFGWLKKAVLILVLTMQIFFSLKIDLSTIKINRTGMMIYVFTQYSLGLICLFFLLNAIFKI